IAAATQARLAALREQGVPVAIYEAPLLIENQLHRGMDGVIVVAIDEETQVERSMRRDELSRAEALARVQAQAPLAGKIAAADGVIDSSGILAETRKQVERVWEEIRAGGPRFR